MKPRRILRPALSWALGLAAVSLFTAPPVRAQDGEDPTEDAAPAVPAGQPDLTDAAIDTAVLQAHLKPLTQDELVTLAEAWVAHVKESEIAVASAVVAEDEEAKTAALEERDARIARAEAVLAELSAKGGDATTYEAYLGNLTGIASGPSLDIEAPKDLDEALNLVSKAKDWVVSTDGGIKWGLNIVKFLVILLAFKIAAAIVGKIVGKAVGRLKKASNLLKDFFVNSTMKVTMFVGFVIALSALGVNIGPFLAAMGAAGFVIGFALQGTLSNFAAGVMILVYRPYDIGDVITAAGVTGKVEAMTLVSTTLLTPDNQVIIIPNGSIWGSVITNITANNTRRVDLVFGIGYEDDMAKAQEILEETLRAHPKVLKSPDITVKVNELADSSVNFIARPWTKTSDYWDVYWDLHRQVKERFDAAGISIPFPQQDVHIHGLPESAGSAKA